MYAPDATRPDRDTVFTAFSLSSLQELLSRRGSRYRAKSITKAASLTLLALLLMVWLAPLTHAQAMVKKKIPAANGMAMTGYVWSKENTKQIVYIDGDGNVQDLSMDAHKIWHQSNLTQLTGGQRSNKLSLAGYDWAANGSEQVVYVDENWHIQELRNEGNGQWLRADLSAITGAPLPYNTSIAGYVWTRTNTKHVVYVDSAGNIHELHAGVSGPWHHTDLTATTGAPPAEGSTIVAYDWSGDGTQQIAYVDEAGHIQELSSREEGVWHLTDLTDLTNAPLAASDAITGYSWLRGKFKQVAYIDENGHVQELFTKVGGTWHYADLTSIAHAPAISTDVTMLTGFDWSAGNAKQIAYTDVDGHVYELSASVSSSWHYTDLMETTDASRAAPIALYGFDWIRGRSKQIIYTDREGRVHELSVIPNKEWQHTNLSMVE